MDRLLEREKSSLRHLRYVFRPIFHHTIPSRAVGLKDSRLCLTTFEEVEDDEKGGGAVEK